MVSGMAHLVYLLSSLDLWELCVASMLLCYNEPTEETAFYSSLRWRQMQHMWVMQLRYHKEYGL